MNVRRYLIMLAALAYTGGIFYLASRPGDAVPISSWWMSLVTNMLHIPLYGGLTVLWFLSLRSGATPISSAVYLLTAALVMGSAVVDEVYQASIPGRTGSVFDVGLDALGMVLIFLGTHWLTKEKEYVRPIRRS